MLSTAIEFVKANKVKVVAVVGAVAVILHVAADHTIAYKLGDYLVKLAAYLQAA